MKHLHRNRTRDTQLNNEKARMTEQVVIMGKT